MGIDRTSSDFGCQLRDSFEHCLAFEPALGAASDDATAKLGDFAERAARDTFDGTVAYVPTSYEEVKHDYRTLYPIAAAYDDAHEMAEKTVRGERPDLHVAEKAFDIAHGIGLGVDLLELGGAAGAAASGGAAAGGIIAGILGAQSARAEGKREGQKELFYGGYAQGMADALYDDAHAPKGDGMYSGGYQAAREYVATLSPDEREALKTKLEQRWAQETGITGQAPARDHLERELVRELDRKKR